MPHSARSLHRHLSILVLGLVAMAATGSTARAQFTWATDNAGNYAGSWTTGSNAGTGFGSWTLSANAPADNFAGNYIATPPNNGVSGFTGGNAFMQYAKFNTLSVFANADRSMSSALAIGDTLSFQWGVHWDVGNGTGAKGFNLYANGTTQVINLNNGGNGNIVLNDSTTVLTAFGSTAMTINVTRNSVSELVISTPQGRNGGSGFSQTLSGLNNTAIDAFRFYASRQEDNDNRNNSFNNFKVANSGTYNFGGSITESRAMIGGGALTVGGNTTLTLTNAGNTFTGGSTVAAGSELTIGNGGANGSLAGNVANSGRLTFNSSSSLTYAGQLSGSGTFVKSGSGLLTLSGNSAGYAGATLLQSGSLNVSGALGGTVEVSSGAVLVGALSVASGKALGGSGTIDGNVSLAANAAFVFDPAETLTVQNGTVSFGGFGVDDILGLDQNTPDGIYTLIAGAVNLANVSNVGAGSAYSLGGGKSAYLQAGSLQLVVVPEPPAVIAVVGGLAGVAAYGFRRRRRA